jgi:hypothetical protein
MTPTPDAPSRTSPVVLFAAWIGVGLPMLWGVMMTVKKAALLFK